MICFVVLRIFWNEFQDLTEKICQISEFLMDQISLQFFLEDESVDNSIAKCYIFLEYSRLPEPFDQILECVI